MMNIKNLIKSAINAVSSKEMEKNKELRKQTLKLLKIVATLPNDEVKGGQK